MFYVILEQQFRWLCSIIGSGSSYCQSGTNRERTCENITRDWTGVSTAILRTGDFQCEDWANPRFKSSQRSRSSDTVASGVAKTEGLPSNVQRIRDGYEISRNRYCDSLQRFPGMKLSQILMECIHGGAVHFQSQNCLLVTHLYDNYSPGLGPGRLVPSPHKEVNLATLTSAPSARKIREFGSQF